MDNSSQAAVTPQEQQLLAEFERLGAENALLHVALERLPLGLSMFDANDVLVLCNKRYSEIWQLPDAQIQPGITFQEIMQITPGQESPASRAQPAPLPGSVGVRKREWVLDDNRIIEIVVTRLADGSCIALHKDITEQRLAEEKIEFLARHDQLTGLANRSAMEEEIKARLRQGEHSQSFAVLCLDLDRFKTVNDAFGHGIGDELLQQVAERIQSCTRASDTVVRFGGDEFAIIQSASPQPEASSSLASRIITVLSRPFDLRGHFAQIGVSIGIALAPSNGTSVDELMKSADLALTRAKDNGRGSFRYFEPQMDERVRARRSLEMDLRRAQDLGELYLVYQPLVNLDSGKVVIAEALLRWQHPQKGNISPAEFIPVAEESGLILAIGRWVLQEACLAVAKWPETVSVAVNVSALQLIQGSLLQDVEHALAISGIAPERLEIEITETVMMQDPQSAMSNLAALAKMGIKLAIDDFGTGYSSLSYLHRYPFDRIKVDRSFVNATEVNEDAKTILHALISLGVNLGLSVVVEGVETQKQLDLVRIAGATEAQGFYLSRPVAQPALLPLLSNNFLKQ